MYISKRYNNGFFPTYGILTFQSAVKHFSAIEIIELLREIQVSALCSITILSTDEGRAEGRQMASLYFREHFIDTTSLRCC